MNAILFFLLFSVSLYSDVRQGELFGFKINSKYPNNISEKEYNMFGICIFDAIGAEKPDDIEKISIMALPKSLKIIRITGESAFESDDLAKEFANKYIEILLSKYPEFQNKLETDAQGKALFSWVLMRVEINKKYELTVDYFKSEENTNAKINISISFLKPSKEHSIFEATLKKEIQELQTEYKKSVRKKAQKEGSDRGL